MPDEIKCSKCQYVGKMIWKARCEVCNSNNDCFKLHESFDYEINEICGDIFHELHSAIKKYPLGFHSNHEAYGTILEELDELWDEIKVHKDVYEMTDKMRAECIQFTAMGIRFILDRYNKK